MNFQPEIARLCLRAVDRAYRRHALGNDLPEPERHATHELIDSAVRVEVYPAFVIVAFRGTDPDDLGEWMRNMDAKLIEPVDFYGGAGLTGRVHRGFYRSHLSSAAAAADILAEFRAAWKPVVVAGHSAGAAEAMLYAMRQFRGRIYAVYRFGGPRVGDAEWASLYDGQLGQKTFNLVLCNDVVPRLPPWRWGYRHAGRAVYIDRKGNLHPDARPSRWWFDRMLARAIGLVTGKGLGAFRRHGVRSYWAALDF